MGSCQSNTGQQPLQRSYGISVDIKTKNSQAIGCFFISDSQAKEPCHCERSVAKQVDFASETQRNRHGLHAGRMPSESRLIMCLASPNYFL